MPNLDTLIAHAEVDPDRDFTVSGLFILAVRDVKDAAAVVVKSEGAYDLEYLEETLDSLEEA